VGLAAVVLVEAASLEYNPHIPEDFAQFPAAGTADGQGVIVDGLDDFEFFATLRARVLIRGHGANQS
jgi:hypothetical protein